MVRNNFVGIRVMYCNQQSAISNQEGFTLVELSIVLVIIGLLIGGILVGQSLIESAKINRLVSDLRQYEVAVVQFRNKYKKYPGDSPNFIPPGTGNNRLNQGAGGVVDPVTGEGTGNCAAAPNAALSNWERDQVWAHLSQAQMLSKSYEAYSPSETCTNGVHESITDISNAGIVHPYTELSGVAATAFGTSKYPIMALKTNAAANFYFQLYTSPLDTLAIENKLGSQNHDFTVTNQIGLVNLYGVGNCTDDNFTFLCTDPRSIFGYLRYYLAP